MDITWKPDAVFDLGERVWHVAADEAYISRINGNVGNDPALDTARAYWRPEREIRADKPLLGPPTGYPAMLQKTFAGVGAKPHQNSSLRALGIYDGGDGMIMRNGPRSTDLTEGSHVFRGTYLRDHDIFFDEHPTAERPHSKLKPERLGVGGQWYLANTSLGSMLVAESGLQAGSGWRFTADHMPVMPSQAVQLLTLVWADRTDNIEMEIGFRQDDANKVYFEVSTGGAASWPWACRYRNNNVGSLIWATGPKGPSDYIDNVAKRRAFAIGFWDGNIQFLHGNYNNTHVEVAVTPVTYDTSKLYFPYVQFRTLDARMQTMRMTSLQMKVTG